MSLEKLELRADVTVGELSLDCAEAMYRWMCDGEVAVNLGLRREPSLEATRSWISDIQENNTAFVRTMLLAGRHVGNVVFDRIDECLGTARLSVYIGEKDVRGHGVGFTGLYRSISAAFGELSLYKIWLTVHVENRRAIGVYERLGFRQEGTLRGEFILDGKRLDAHYMGVLEEEFFRLGEREA